jgi:hypothetical protein
MKLNRHCERSEAIHRAAWTEWIASSLSLLAMTAESVIEPNLIATQAARAGNGIRLIGDPWSSAEIGRSMLR